MAKRNILVVEDESIVGKDIQNRLKNLGYAVTAVVPSGEKALKEIEIKKPDLILMDIMLKGEMNGVEAASIIKEKYDIPVVFLTAYADDNTLSKAKLAEPYGYIIKPFKEKELQTTIEVALYKQEKDVKVKKERDFYYSIIENQGSPNSIFIRADYRLNKINFKDIYYVEALKDYVVIITKTDTFTTHSTMKEMMKLLPATDFIRIHRSYIVNISKIFSIKFPDLIIEDKMKVLPVGGLFKKDLYDKLNLV